MLVTFLNISAMILSYLSGSVCSAVIVSKLCGLPDPCSAGSKNPGATNVLRLAGKKYAIIVLLADMMKGFIPVFLAKIANIEVEQTSLIGLAAIIGHMYPIFFKFKGGKGVATTLGALIGMDYILAVAVIGTWLFVALLTRYSSLASLIAIILTPVYSIYLLENSNAFFPLTAISIVVCYQHRHNMIRLLNRTEPKVSFNKSKPT
ncbi:MAG: glycerol-3-phosphate 1-O-acyltransferase PlsY [Legionella sp.]